MINFSLEKLRTLDAIETGRVKNSDKIMAVASLAMEHWSTCPSQGLEILCILQLLPA